MARIARVVVTGYPHHVTQRGNNHEIVFYDDRDRQKYLNWLKEYSEKFGLQIWAYCLMTNHVHFVVVPETQDSIAKTLGQLHMRYALYFNTKRKRSGHLWQGRFYSSILDSSYLYAAVRYVERNPVRADLVKYAEEYPWSSAKAHVFNLKDPPLSHCPLLEEIHNWANYLMSDDDPIFVEGLRKGALSGRPSGDPDFVTKMEKCLGRSFKANPVGRPWSKKLVTTLQLESDTN